MIKLEIALKVFSSFPFVSSKPGVSTKHMSESTISGNVNRIMEIFSVHDSSECPASPDLPVAISMNFSVLVFEQKGRKHYLQSSSQCPWDPSSWGIHWRWLQRDENLILENRSVRDNVVFARQVCIIYRRHSGAMEFSPWDKVKEGIKHYFRLQWLSEPVKDLCGLVACRFLLRSNEHYVIDLETGWETHFVSTKPCSEVPTRCFVQGTSSPWK